MTLLDVVQLGLEVRDSNRILLRDLNLRIERGSITGLVGESGSGKSMLSLSLMGLLPDGIRIISGRATIGATQILDSHCEFRSAARNEMALISQNPRAALNPTMRIGKQMARVLRQRRALSRQAADEEARRLLRQVGITDTERIWRSYPHQLSGGMCQRVIIGMALSTEPSLLIADEPTTGLDVTIQAQILLLLRNLVAGGARSVLLITHDLAVVSSLCDRVVVLYGGEVMEAGATVDVFTRPRHPYTKFLLASAGLDVASDSQRIREAPVDFTLAGCRFARRCALATGICLLEAPPLHCEDASAAYCHHLEPARAAAC